MPRITLAEVMPASATARTAEVGDLHVAVIGDQDVLGLDVAVDEARRVGGAETAEDRPQRGRHRVRGIRPRSRNSSRRLPPSTSSMTRNTTWSSMPGRRH